MKRVRKSLWIILLAGVLLAAGVVWLLWEQGGHRQGLDWPDQISRDNSGNGNGAPEANNGEANGATEHEPDTDGGNKTPGNTNSAEEPNFPDVPENQPWDPADFANERLAWRIPHARQDAARPVPEKEYQGSPVFMEAGGYRAMPERFGTGGFFDPVQPDGMLEIRLGWVENDQSEEWRSTCSVEATSHDGTFVYSLPKSNGETSLVVPYAYKRFEVIGLLINGPRMLPIEARIGQAGTGLRREILVLGQAWYSFRCFPADYADFRQVHVQNSVGEPVSDAVITWDGVQIYGRSDAVGTLRFPWIPKSNVSGNLSLEDFFFITAPGYVPVLLERSVLENAAVPVEVTLKARELLVSAYETVPRPEVLKLGANIDRQSAVLRAGLDLIPVPDDWPEFQEWTDVQRAIGYGYFPERFDRHHASGKLQDDHPDGVIQFYQSKGTGPYEPGHAFGDEGARKLARVLNRHATEHWPEYARWYYGRWDYNERDGRFDVVLPFPGRFLLAVGEYNHGPKGDERNGGLTHVLHIDARDPANVKSKLLIHPLG